MNFWVKTNIWIQTEQLRIDTSFGLPPDISTYGAGYHPLRKRHGAGGSVARLGLGLHFKLRASVKTEPPKKPSHQKYKVKEALEWWLVSFDCQCKYQSE